MSDRKYRKYVLQRLVVVVPSEGESEARSFSRAKRAAIEQIMQLKKSQPGQMEYVGEASVEEMRREMGRDAPTRRQE